MDLLIKRTGSRDLLTGAALLLAAASLVIWPQETMSAMREGLSLCGNVIIPSLFPFFVLSSLVVELGMARYIGRLLEPVMFPLFRVTGACASALALGLIGGYPVGARTAISLYQNGQCSRTEAERLLAFSNNCGPAFIFGVVGTGVFGSGQAGLLLYATHLASSLLVGLLFRFYGKHEDRTQHRLSSAFQAVNVPSAFTHAVTRSVSSLLNICGFILFFTVMLRILSVSGILSALAASLSLLLSPAGLSPQWGERLLTGLLEVSSGVTSLTFGNLHGRLSMAAFMLGWAGLSVHCQVLAFLTDSGLSSRTYLLGKILHGLFSASLTTILIRIVPLELPVSLYLTEQAQSISQLDFQQSLTLSALAAWAVWLIFLLLTVVVVKKSSRKPEETIL